MKIRHCVMVLILVLVIGYMGSVFILSNEQYTSVNMDEINDRFKSVEENLSLEGNGISDSQVHEFEKEYDCEILFCQDDQYETKYHNAVADQMIVLDYMENGNLAGKVIFEGQKQKLQELYERIERHLLYLFIALFVGFSMVFFWIYWEYIRPFRTLETFATQISKGNLDFPLKMQKHNYFGAFTESFDIMREELKRARQGELEANQSKKELVASLSHDIKTPVATIKAVCEILLLKVKDELVLDKLLVIDQKAGVIDSLISNMFHATLEELKLLKVTPEEVLSTQIPPIIEDINYEGKIHFRNNIPECLIRADLLRLTQVIDNIINNSYKYAATDIEVSFTDLKDEIAISIRDFGTGVEKEELPLLTEKFYRGRNAKGKDGSGLGLYLSRQFMEGMQGDIRYENEIAPSGFHVTLTLQRV